MLKRLNILSKNEFDKLGLEEHKEFIHFGLTSQDINNTAIPYSLNLLLKKFTCPRSQSC
jgi:adenylosuccinate lyase